MNTSFFLCLLMQTRGRKKTREEMGGLVHTEMRVCTRVACELGVPLLATKSLEGSNQAVQCTDDQVFLSSGYWDPVMVLAVRFMPSSVFSSSGIQVCSMVQRLVHILWEQTLKAPIAVSLKRMPGFQWAEVQGDGPCLHEDCVVAVRWKHYLRTRQFYPGGKCTYRLGMFS